MTSLHFIVYALCLSTASMTYVWFKAFCKLNDIELETKRLGNRLDYISRDSVDSYIKGAISMEIDKIANNNRREFEKLRNEYRDRSERYAKVEIQHLWEKQFFTNK